MQRQPWRSASPEGPQTEIQRPGRRCGLCQQQVRVSWLPISKAIWNSFWSRSRLRRRMQRVQPLFGLGGLVPAYNLSPGPAHCRRHLQQPAARAGDVGRGRQPVSRTARHEFPAGDSDVGRLRWPWPVAAFPTASSYTPSNNPNSVVADGSIRTISNLIVDQTLSNPAAIVTALERAGSADPFADLVIVQAAAELIITTAAAATAAQAAELPPRRLSGRQRRIRLQRRPPMMLHLRTMVRQSRRLPPQPTMRPQPRMPRQRSGGCAVPRREHQCCGRCLGQYSGGRGAGRFQRGRRGGDRTTCGPCRTRRRAGRSDERAGVACAVGGDSGSVGCRAICQCRILRRSRRQQRWRMKM